MWKGEKIILRAIEPGDIDIHYRWENNVKNWNITNTSIPFSRETLMQYISSVKDIYADKQFRFVIDTHEGKPVGFIDLFEFDPIHKRAGVGILIGEDEDRGKGYAADALAVLINYCREILRLQNLFCNILVSNNTSVKLFEKYHFKPVGTKSSWHWNGKEWEDELLYQLPLFS